MSCDEAGIIHTKLLMHLIVQLIHENISQHNYGRYNYTIALRHGVCAIPVLLVTFMLTTMGNPGL